MEHRREARAGHACRSEARCKETYKQTRCLWYAFQTMLNLSLISARAGRYGQKKYHDNFFHISRYR